MGLLPPFSCGPEDNALCFNGGRCNSNGTACECPDGFVHDWMLFKSDNCALPAWGTNFFIVVAGVNALVSLALMGSLYCHGLERTPQRGFLLRTCAAVVSRQVYLTSIAANEGMNVVSSLFFGISATLTISLWGSVLLATLTPLFSHRSFNIHVQKAYQRFHRMITVGMAVSQLFVLISSFFMAVFNDDVTAYDTASFFLILSCLLAFFFFLVVTWTEIALLKNLLITRSRNARGLDTDDSIDSSSQHIVAKLVHYRRLFVLSSFFLCSILLSLAFARYFVGSLPYQWLIVLAGGLSALISGVTGVSALFKGRASNATLVRNRRDSGASTLRISLPPMSVEHSDADDGPLGRRMAWSNDEETKVDEHN